jgi:SAM-dependent methyltransferase
MSDRPNATAETADFEFAALNEAKNYRRALIREFSGALHGRVLEVGAGVGQMTQEMLALKSINHLLSIEPDPRFFEKLKLNLPGHTIFRGIAGELKTSEGWDAILSVNVLEHIQNDQEELSIYRHLLSDRKGRLCLFVPARKEIYAPIDKDFGHFRRYSRTDLLEKLNHAGFRVERLRYYNFVGYFLWWANFCLLRQRNFNVTSVRLFDRVAFPVIYTLERNLFSPPLGQSLLAIARAD